MSTGFFAGLVEAVDSSFVSTPRSMRIPSITAPRGTAIQQAMPRHGGGPTKAVRQAPESYLASIGPAGTSATTRY